MTDAQKKVFEVICRKQRMAGPSVREVAKELGCSGPAVAGHVEKLRQLGELDPETGNGLVVKPGTFTATIGPIETAKPAKTIGELSPRIVLEKALDDISKLKIRQPILRPSEAAKAKKEGKA